MNKRNFRVGVSGLLAMLSLASAASAATNATDCRAEPPAAQSRDADSLNQGSGASTLSRELATCGSVLNPPPVGDPDIVEPAPRIGDPMNIHPSAPDSVRP